MILILPEVVICLKIISILSDYWEQIVLIRSGYLSTVTVRDIT